MLRALAAAGHGARVLITDGNYPASTAAPLQVERVHLNLCQGSVTVTEVLRILLRTIPVESAALMQPPDESWPPIQQEIKALLPANLPLRRCIRAEFYAEARSADTALVVVTGDARRFANIILTIGVLASE